MPEYEGTANNHACIMARAKEHCKVIHVGIRSVDIVEYENVDPDRVFYAHQIHENDDWMDKVLSLLTKNVYITFDLDAFDPSLLPATGTPEPGGMGWYQVMKLLKKVIARTNVVGFDVVELCPRPGDRTSDYVAAKLIYKLLSYKFEEKK
jgi:agmatinase